MGPVASVAFGFVKVRDIVVAVGLCTVLLLGCSDGGDQGSVVGGSISATVAAVTTVADTTIAAAQPTTSTVAATTTSAARPTTSTVAATTTTAVPPSASTGGDAVTLRELGDIPFDQPFTFGTSVQGRPLTVVRRGDPDGVRVLVIGVIHGNEDAGAAIVDQLAVAALPPGVQLFLVRAVNPDGMANQIRQNANGVDLNRNFPEKWGPVAAPGNWEYAGPSAASEPETTAMVALGDVVRADLTLWYHQDLFRISPGTGRQGQIRERYAALTGLPLVEVSGGTYTGTASQWSRVAAADNGVGFTVELGPTLSDAEAAVHAVAVLTIATEL